MTLEIRLIPDGLTEVPTEARDHGALAGHLEAASNIPDDANAPISGWRDVVREVPGDKSEIRLRVPGVKNDYPGSSLSAIVSAISSNVAGVKEHPEGWREVEE